MITGLQTNEEPTLYLWGLRVSDDSFEPWDLLIAARERFESNLPVERPLTEPDIALHLPGKYLILIEAKFTSPNSFYVDGPRQNHVSLTKSELLDIYWDDAITALDRVKARTADRVHYQLWRNLIFAEWMASRDAMTTRPYLASLTRAGYEAESCGEFHNLLAADRKPSFRHFNWEQVAMQTVATEANPNLVAYLSKKTARLRPAFCDWNTMGRS